MVNTKRILGRKNREQGENKEQRKGGGGESISLLTSFKCRVSWWAQNAI